MQAQDDRPTVMLVDDKPANLRYMQEIFSHSDYRVVLFPSGELALEAATKKPPDIILLDVLMPDMDGFEVCERLQAEPTLQDIPVLFLSALVDPRDKEKAFHLGAKDYVTKPFHPSELLSRVTTHLKLRRMTMDLEKQVEKRTEELRAANQNLSASREMLKAVFEGIAEPLFLVDSNDLEVNLYNVGARKYYEEIYASLQEKPERLPDIRVQEEDILTICGLRELLASTPPQQYTRQRPGWSDRIEKISLYNALSDTDESKKIIRISDITEERKLTQQLTQHDKLIALGTLVAGVAHEINNPNHIIALNSPIVLEAWRTALQLLEETGQQGNDMFLGNVGFSEISRDIEPLIQDIEASSERITRIVGVLKNYAAKADTFSPMPLNITECLKSAQALLAHKIRQSTNRFEVDLENDLPKISGDKQQLEQLFVNFIDNALESLSEKTRAVRIRAWFDKEKKEVVVEVCDEGCGIAEEHLQQIMDPFFTTKRSQGGTGLGMSIVHRILEEHGANLEIQSQKNQGTCMIIRLPTKEAADSPRGAS